MKKLKRAAKLKEQHTWTYIKGVNKNIFSNQFGILELPETWIIPTQLCGARLCFADFKSSLQLLQLFSRMLQLCSAAKLQKCVVD